MLRAAHVACVLLTGSFVSLAPPGAARADEPPPSTGGFSAGPGASPDYRTDVSGPSPEWTQDRTFPGTRFWKLDAGTMEVEAWWRIRSPRHADTFHIYQLEYEVGLTPRVQLDLYENLTTEGTGELHHEGNQIEARIAVDPVFGRTPLNPVVYLEWHPRHLQADRAEVRLLLGDEILGPKLVGAVNLFYEQNLTDGPDGAGGQTFVPNPEAGFTAAASYGVLGQTLRVGAEVKLAFEKEEFDDAEWEKQLLVGPNLAVRLAGEHLKLCTTVLFGVTDDAKKVDAFVIVASTL
jgi:hypothetical protein